MSNAPTPVPLPHAGDLPSRYGISYEVAGPVARIAVPNSTRLRYRLAEFALPAVLLLYAGATAVALVDALLLVRLRPRPPTMEQMVWNGILALTLAPAVWVGVREWLRQARRRTVFELDERALVIDDYDPAGKPRRRSWAREQVGDVRPGPVPWNAPAGRGLGLHIRITGRTIVEVMPGHDPAVAGWVAEQINTALAGSVRPAGLWRSPAD